MIPFHDHIRNCSRRNSTLFCGSLRHEIDRGYSLPPAPTMMAPSHPRAKPTPQVGPAERAPVQPTGTDGLCATADLPLPLLLKPGYGTGMASSGRTRNRPACSGTWCEQPGCRPRHDKPSCRPALSCGRSQNCLAPLPRQASCRNPPVAYHARGKGEKPGANRRATCRGS